ncbi:MAG: hypothetical protein HWN67_14755 [Candidatus Helarchaeota archaeon]|nr:hypothetical protein [Candidatus Helarchaeota archaeon]
MDEDLLQSIIILCVLSALTIFGIITVVIVSGKLLDTSALNSYYAMLFGLIYIIIIIKNL